VLLTENPIVYLYHRKVLIAQTDAVDGLRASAGRLVRVVG
jgi:hypothetical protein